jgi:IS605 OrfB family transposase
MKIISSYKVKIKEYNGIFTETVRIYRAAVAFFIGVCEKEGDLLLSLKGKKRNNYIETVTISTEKHPDPKYRFNDGFYKFPSYLRRSAIQTAIGAYSSYRSNYKNWEKGEKIGKEPKLTLDRGVMPVLYKGNTYVRTGETSARIKIYQRNDWIWLDVELRKQDVAYIQRNCALSKELVPTLKKVGKRWYLVFPFENSKELKSLPALNSVVCAVDLGLNNNAVCSIMQSEGTVAARKFINLAAEKDRLKKAVGRVKKAQQKGNRKTPVKWKHANDQNMDISRKTAKAIVEFATRFNANVIVFEHLDTSGRKKGSSKQRLALWRKQEIQRITEHKAHKGGLRISRVCAWGTSKLAYDGGGIVSRGVYTVNGTEKYNYSVCVFQNGKTYHCDLNASYNIGARYFIREILKSEPAMVRLPDEAKVLRYGTGTTRTLSTLIRLNADLCAEAHNA